MGAQLFENNGNKRNGSLEAKDLIFWKALALKPKNRLQPCPGCCGIQGSLYFNGNTGGISRSRFTLTIVRTKIFLHDIKYFSLTSLVCRDVFTESCLLGRDRPANKVDWQ